MIAATQRIDFNESDLLPDPQTRQSSTSLPSLRKGEFTLCVMFLRVDLLTHQAFAQKKQKRAMIFLFWPDAVSPFDKDKFNRLMEATSPRKSKFIEDQIVLFGSALFSV